MSYGQKGTEYNTQHNRDYTDVYPAYSFRLAECCVVRTFLFVIYYCNIIH